MKKILCLILAVVCTLLAVSCRYIPPEEETDRVNIPILYDSSSPTHRFGGGDCSGSYCAEHDKWLILTSDENEDSSVDVVVKKITFEKSDGSNRHIDYIGCITLELTSHKTQNLSFYLRTINGGDFFGCLENKTVFLPAHSPQTVKIPFYHSLDSYVLYTLIDNTYLQISFSNIDALFPE